MQKNKTLIGLINNNINLYSKSSKRKCSSRITVGYLVVEIFLKPESSEVNTAGPGDGTLGQKLADLDRSVD